jgi:hypothetical protein
MNSGALDTGSRTEKRPNPEHRIPVEKQGKH